MVYYGLRVSKEIFTERIKEAKQYLTSKEEEDFWRFFDTEFEACKNREVKEYTDAVLLEYKVKWLMNIAQNFCFETKKMKAKTIEPFDNTIFPMKKYSEG